ncbi:hypothetical protein BH11ACT2_BH11ACT2_21960 [soil metagenome]
MSRARSCVGAVLRPIGRVLPELLVRVLVLVLRGAGPIVQRRMVNGPS